MKNIYKWRLTCSTHGTVYNYSEDDVTAPNCPHVDTDTITDSVIVDSLSKEIIGTETLTGKTSDKLKVRGLFFTATKNQVTEVDWSITEDIYIKDGRFLSDKNVFGDRITVELHHPVAGLQHIFVNDCPIEKNGETAIKDETMSELNFNGLILKVKYDSKGLTDDVECSLRIDGAV
jgi:hypothetical protein